ncbi:hypothetical protein [Streptomyces sp. NPDC059092]|uniref:hypothetical protein n=1 Tax=Streptomyces sp. NPDC059092 TaxID=3346725 RepID=UPI0036791DC0
MNIATTALMNTGHHAEGPPGTLNTRALAGYADRTSRIVSGRASAICAGGALSALVAAILQAGRW